MRNLTKPTFALKDIFFCSIFEQRGQWKANHLIYTRFISNISCSRFSDLFIRSQ